MYLWRHQSHRTIDVEATVQSAGELCTVPTKAAKLCYHCHLVIHPRLVLLQSRPRTLPRDAVFLSLRVLRVLHANSSLVVVEQTETLPNYTLSMVT